MAFVRKAIGEREEAVLADMGLAGNRLALPFVLEDDERGLFLCVKQFHVGEGKYQVLVMKFGRDWLEFRLEAERSERYPVQCGEKLEKGLSTEELAYLLLPAFLKGREREVLALIEHTLSESNPFYDTKIRQVKHIEYRKRGDADGIV